MPPAVDYGTWSLYQQFEEASPALNYRSPVLVFPKVDLEALSFSRRCGLCKGQEPQADARNDQHPFGRGIAQRGARQQSCTWRRRPRQRSPAWQGGGTHVSLCCLPPSLRHPASSSGSVLSSSVRFPGSTNPFCRSRCLSLPTAVEENCSISPSASIQTSRFHLFLAGSKGSSPTGLLPAPLLASAGC